MRSNRRQVKRTHEGAPAKSIKKIDELRRSVLSCLLWEKSFYESGEDIGQRIFRLSQECDPGDVAKLAWEARKVHNLRHAPLVLLCGLLKTSNGDGLASEAIARVLSRADELPELVALYEKFGSEKWGNQLRKGLAKAFVQFDEYQLAKWDRPGKWRLRDVLLLCHAKPQSAEQSALFKRLLDGELKRPDTWEVALSSGSEKKTLEQKKAQWERLLDAEKLGFQALLKNLRGMTECAVDKRKIRKAIRAGKGARKLLPMDFIAAARAVPWLEPEIDAAFAEVVDQLDFPGTTAVLVDVSPSMNWASFSERGTLDRLDGAGFLASAIPADERRTFVFSHDVEEVPSRVGMAGLDAIRNSGIERNGTYLGKAIRHVQSTDYDRLIVITDEQSHDPIPGATRPLSYMINVAPEKNGVGYRDGWIHIDGFSPAVLKYIEATEKQSAEIGLRKLLG